MREMAFVRVKAGDLNLLFKYFCFITVSILATPRQKLLLQETRQVCDPSQYITDIFCLSKDMLSVFTYKDKQSDSWIASFISSRWHESSYVTSTLSHSTHMQKADQVWWRWPWSAIMVQLGRLVYSDKRSQVKPGTQVSRSRSEKQIDKLQWSWWIQQLLFIQDKYKFFKE